MKNFGRFRKYVSAYTWRLIASVLLQIASTTSALISFTMVIPFLGILFKQQPIVTVRVPFEMSYDAIMGNLNYFLSKILVEQGEHTALVVVSLLVVIATLFKSLFNYLGNHVIVPLRTGVIKDMRNSLYTKIIYLPMKYFSNERKGDLISRMIGDVKEVEGSMVNQLQVLVKSPIELIMFITTLFIMSAKLTLFVLVLLPISGYLISKIGKSLKRKAAKGQIQLGKLLINTEETLFGIRIIKAFTAEKKAEKRFFKENDSFSLTQIKVFRRKFLAHPISEFMGTLVVVVVMWFGASIVLNNQGALSPQSFITYIIIFSQVIPPAKAVSNLYFDMNKGMAAFERVLEVLDADESIKNAPGAEKVDQFNSEIEYKDVNFAYENDVKVLKNINLNIRKGQMVALVGPSGGGKSTLVDLLPRFYDVENGLITLDGKPIIEYDIISLRRLIGIVTQEQILFNDSIYNNIAFGVEDVSKEEVIQAAKVANAHEFIMNTEDGYDTNIGDRGSKLSGGQRQRLTIARAVLTNPPILILDEATSALDAESEKLVQEALDNLMKNRTSIVIAHRLTTVKNADLVCVVKDGKIIEQGKHDELLESESAFKQLYQQQMS